VLTAQQFYPATDAGAKKAITAKPYSFLFERCTDALAAFRERMPKLIELAKAIAIAELEIDGQYSESKHDALFEQFGANGLDPQIWVRFPIICLRQCRKTAG